MKFARLLLALLVCCALGCSDVETRTKITFRIEASETLQAQTAALQINVRSDAEADVKETFERRELTLWPVDIIVIPKRGNDGDYGVTLTAVLLDASGRELASKSAKATFTPERQLVVPLLLMSTSISESPSTGTDGGPPDRGGDMPTDGAPPMRADAGRPPRGEPGEEERDAGPTAVEPDAGPGKETCASPGSTILCDDGNPCNGIERCDPTNASAIENGCLAGTMVACADGTTCRPNTGTCSACGGNEDGDGDGVKSISCGGADCNDGDPAIAPGKPELCDAKDNDCNGTADGVDADPGCASKKPRGGTAACVAGACKVSCTDPTHVIENGVCVAPVTSCPTPNPCAPGGSCKAQVGGYACTCDADHRVGVGGASRCASRGLPERTLGFETDCADVVLDGFVAETKAIGSDFYAGCGVSAIMTGGMLTRPQLIKPTLAIDGLKGTNALVGGESEVTIAFAPAITNVAFDVLDLDNPTTLQVTVEPPALTPITPMIAADAKRASVSYRSTTPIARVVIKYTPLTTTDAWYVDSLSFLRKGCGDAVVDVGEDCDDGDSVQCNGCDNACKVSVNGCLQGNSCASGRPVPMSATGACPP